MPGDARLTRFIRADAATVYGLLAEVELWPALFPHIRSARVMRRRGHQRLLAVRASWRGLPVAWRAVQTLDRANLRLTFRHVNVLSRGSAVSWTVVPGPGGVHVTVAQQVRLRVPLIGPWIAGYVLATHVGPQMAAEMLGRLQALAEGGSLADLS